jgi:lysine 2,3-aminomutase
MRAAARTLRRPTDLAEAGLVAPERLADLERVAAQYAVAISPAMAALINPADPHDPIARQFVPDPAELQVVAAERGDPIGDDARSPVAGIVHRYPDRVLLKLVHVCPVYCRFCFRREQVGPPEIWEVILTGGDPLILSARRLRAVVRELAAIEHVKVIRVHTRVPVATPERVTRETVRALKAPGKASYVVVHVNHARELTPAARAACARFIDAGVPMLSQSVLLRGVNDDAATLGALMRALVESRIKPYYLHQGDLARGTAHLRTSIEAGQDLMRALRGRYSGLCQPTYVLDIPGGFGKVPIGANYLAASVHPASYVVRDPQGQPHAYPPVAGVNFE